MRKNKGNRKNIKNVFITYRITGLNLDRLINAIKKEGITLYNVKKQTDKKMTLSINFYENEKFFAITDKLCYNKNCIKKVRVSGAGYPLFFLAKNVGIILGVMIFTFSAIFSNDFIFDFTFSGSGQIYSREITEYLNTKGVKKYSRFSSINLKNLANDILRESGRFTFVSCEKDGNRLHVNLVLKERVDKALTGKEQSLISTVDGVLESIKVYRGTALKKVGEKISVGDVLVDGYAVIKEQTVLVNVIAVATVISEYEYVYTSKVIGEDDTAIILARENLGDKDIVDESLLVTNTNDEFIYTVKIKYRNVLYAG